MATLGLTLGRIDEFQPGKGISWEEYTEQLEYYFDANDIGDAVKRRAVLLSVCGQTTFSLIRSLVSPAKPSEFLYQQLVNLVKEHLSPKPNEIVQRFKFYKRNQESTESISEYVVALRKLADECNFGTHLNTMLRDRFVCGIASEAIQHRLLAEADLDFSKALNIALAAESAKQYSSEIRKTVSQPDINVIEKKLKEISVRRGTFAEGNQHTKPCFRCGNPHSPTTCRFANVNCTFCGKRGHIQSVCFSKAKSNGSTTVKTYSKGNKKKSRAHQVNADPNLMKEEISLNDTEYFLNTLKHRNIEPFYLTLKLNGIEHKMEIDSGSAFSLINKDTYHQQWPDHPPELTEEPLVLRTWYHQSLSVYGVLVSVEFKNKKFELPLRVLKGSGSSLLGRDWFETLRIKLSGLNTVSSDSKHFEDLLGTTSTIFQEGLGHTTDLQSSFEWIQRCCRRF